MNKAWMQDLLDELGRRADAALDKAWENEKRRNRPHQVHRKVSLLRRLGRLLGRGANQFCSDVAAGWTSASLV